MVHKIKQEFKAERDEYMFKKGKKEVQLDKIFTGLPRPHFVRPRNDETTCHAERRIDLCVSCHAELVSASHGNKIPEPLQEDPFCTKSADFGKRRQVRDDIRNRHCEDGFSGGRRVSVANPARKVAFGRYSDATPNNPIEHSEDAAIQRETAPTLTLPHKGGSTTPSLEGRLGWVPIRGAVAKSNKKIAFTLAEVFLSHFAGRRKIAFTLAEVLITLGIVGIVAAMTLPALVQHYRKVEYSSRLKKFYSSMNQAILLSQVQNGSPSEWNKVGTIYDNEGKIDGNANNEFASSFFLKYLGPYMKYTKIERGKVYFADGSTALMWNGGCIDFNFDVNGDSKPNQAGRDVFAAVADRYALAA